MRPLSPRRLLASVALVAGAIATAPVPVAAACGDAPGPGVDWNGCSLEFSELSDLDLSGANLSGAEMSYSVLFRTNLSNSDLRGTNLKDAFPVNANLSGADARKANLIDADLVAANLTNTDFRGGDLRGADLDLSAIAGANFVGANLSGTDFSKVSGADQAVFAAPPVGVNDVAVVEAGKTVNIRVLGNDDPKNTNPRARMTVKLVTKPSSGTFDAASGVYRPNRGFSGVDTFTYRPVDTVTLENAPANAAKSTEGSLATVTVRVVERAVLEAPFAGASGDRAEIVRLYLAVFNRAPDDSGFNFWLNRYRNGDSLVAIAAGFSDSSEFLGDTGSLSDRAFVTLMYHNVFIRNPDAAGLGFWLNESASGMSRARLIVLFANGPEFKTFTGTS